MLLSTEADVQKGPDPLVPTVFFGTVLKPYFNISLDQ